MQEETEQFGMNQADVSNYKRGAFFSKVKYYFLSIEPAIVKILNATIYYTLKFLKALVGSVIRMVMGKEV
jgi:hypothetical protein